MKNSHSDIYTSPVKMQVSLFLAEVWITVWNYELSHKTGNIHVQNLPVLILTSVMFIVLNEWTY